MLLMPRCFNAAIAPAVAAATTVAAITVIIVESDPYRRSFGSPECLQLLFFIFLIGSFASIGRVFLPL